MAGKKGSQSVSLSCRKNQRPIVDGPIVLECIRNTDCTAAAHDVALIPDGGFIISSYSSSWGPGDHDGILVRLTEDGRLLWLKSYGDRFDDRISHAALMDDGGFDMIGYSTPAGTDGLDLVTRRTDAESSLLWSPRSGGNRPDEGKAIILSDDGERVVVGGTQNVQPPYDDVFMIQFTEQASTR